jgi:hypothetical protein
MIPDRDNWRSWYVNQDYTFIFEGHTFIVRKGYRFDGHSVPWFVRWLFNTDTNLEAALLHDYILDTMPWHRFGKRFAARAYLAHMQGDTWLRRTFMPPSVSAYAWFKTCIKGDYRGEIKPRTVVEVRVVQ